MEENSIDEPYCNNIHDAVITKQTSRKIITEHLSANNDEIKFSVQIEIDLVPGGVEVSYNPKIFKFQNKEKKALFQREMNSFFINRGFLLERILFKENVYRCCTELRNNNGFMFSPNIKVINKEEAEDITRLITRSFTEVK